MPKRGEAWLVDFGVTQKVRPALIIKSRVANEVTGADAGRPRRSPTGYAAEPC